MAERESRLRNTPIPPETGRVNISRTPEELAELKRKVVQAMLEKIPRSQIAKEVGLSVDHLDVFIASYRLNSIASPADIQVRRWKRKGGTRQYKR